MWPSYSFVGSSVLQTQPLLQGRFYYTSVRIFPITVTQHLLSRIGNLWYGNFVRTRIEGLNYPLQLLYLFVTFAKNLCSMIRDHYNIEIKICTLE